MPRVASVENPFISTVGYPENVALLLEEGADANARMANNWTPLHGAAKPGSPENIRVLLDAGADVSAVHDIGETPFDLAEANEAVKASEEYQILLQADIN